MTRKYLLLIIAVWVLIPALALAAQAAVVGHFTKVEGQVDILKGGRLPAVPAQISDSVEKGDVIRTKSKSRAQVKFVDDTILSLAPESRVAVVDYLYDGPRGLRRTIIQVFRGLAHTVVKQLLQLRESDFTMQTHTSVIGVRGTEWYTLILPNSTNVYNIRGLLELWSSNRRIPGSLMLHTLKYREVYRDRLPGPEMDVTPGILALLQRMMIIGVKAVPMALPGGKTGLPAEIERPPVPEGVIPPYTPPLIPTHPTQPHTPHPYTP